MPSTSSFFDEARKEFSGLQQNYNIEDAASIEAAIQRIEQTLPAEASQHGTCYHCSEEKRVTDTSMLKRGQHITTPGGKTRKIRSRVPKFPFLYKHHAIITKVDVEDEHRVRLGTIHVNNKERHVTEKDVCYDLREDYVWIVNYKRVQRTYEDVAQAAEKQLANAEPNRYNAFKRNCEHFASCCVLGRDHSLQVDSIFSRATQTANKLQGPGGRLIARIVAKFTSEFLDEIALGVTASKCISGIVLGGTAVVTLLYSIVMTMYYRDLHKSSEMCPCCLRRKVLEVWLGFAVFASTSAATFCMLNLAIPLATVVTSGLTVVVILLSLYTQWEMPKIVRAIYSPFDIEGKRVITLEEIHLGEVVSFEYWFFKHYGIVTEKTSSGVKIVHYSTSHPFATRTIVEEKYALSHTPMMKYDCSHLERYTPEETVRRARMRINETKWGPVVNRSDQMCYWAKILQFQPTYGNAHSSLPVKMMLGTTHIHLASEIEVGDHAFLKNTDGIVCRKEDTTGSRTFGIHLVCCRLGKCTMRFFFGRPKRRLGDGSTIPSSVLQT
ncbi:uncharacterized protein LOC128219809 [Mya arenaria]|uniref:uncharacterized protein LOC128219809 n=1 Tax=Mya arenaria TaxID=6604 RepID=UPI0022E66588|nr:uncharacterized protein LOC128219809 [Mya arenaria]XP_052783806.1 uncharacterized protein LOC128219809 [Mya arenaria]XP_052783807.1 uncharacterized protein LOC128219809 [Mya arenaria]XP_052783808.1 uncharacterized protein LOC128219809 [Mya arenaria]